MSMGEQTLTPDELAQLSQRPPVVAPVEEGPVAPMPGDSLIDRENASPLPPGAPTGAMPPDAGVWPPPVPEEAPGAVPAAPPLPGGPVAMPPAAGPPMAPGDRMARADADVRAAATDAAKARDASDKAAMDVAESGAPLARQNAALAGQQTIDHQIAALDQQEAQKRYDDADKVAQAKVDEAANARKNFQFRDYWANKSSGQEIASALAVALGAFGAGLTKGPNYALQILDKDMDDDHRQQVEESQRLTDAEVMARTGLKDVSEARRQDLVNRQMNSAIGDQLIATQMREAAARSTDANFQKTVGAYAAKLSADSSEKLLETRAAIRTGLIKEQDDQAKRAEEAARTRLYNAQADAGGYARLAHGRGGAGGGSSVGGDAVAQLKDAIEAGNNGKPLTASEIQQRANELHIPAFAKPGRPSVEAITKSVAFVAGQGQKAAAAGAKTDHADASAIDKRAESVKKELFGPKAPGTQYERLNGMTAVVANAIKSDDKAAATAILEEAGGMLSGGKSTKTTVQLLEELRSARDELSSKWGHLTGDPGATTAFTQRLGGLLNRVKEEKRQEIDQIRSRYVDQEMGEHGLSKAPGAKERVLGHASMFNGVTNADGTPRYGAGSPAPAGDTVTLRNPKTGETKTVTRAEARALGAIK